MESIVIALGVLATLIVIVWHLANGRIVTQFALYMLILVWETCGGLALAYIEHGPEGLSGLVDAVQVRLLGLGAFVGGYVVASVALGIPTGAHARLLILRDMSHVGARTVTYRLVWTAILLAAIATVPLLYKISAAGGLWGYVSTAYQWRFGTHTTSAIDNNFVVIASLANPVLMTVLCALAMVWRQGLLARVMRRFAATAFTYKVGLGLVNGSRSAALASMGAPVIAAHMLRPFAIKHVCSGVCALVVGAIIGNWVHYKAFELTAGWAAQSAEDTSLALLSPQGHLSTLSAVLENARNHEAIGSEPLVASGAVVVPRVVWPSKPPSDETGTLAVQNWAGLPTAYQKAPTDVGVAVAHLGTAGIALLGLTGLIYSWLDRHLYSGLIGRAAVLGACITRVLVDQGMGVSALSLTIFGYLTSVVLLVLLLRIPSDRPVMPVGAPSRP